MNNFIVMLALLVAFSVGIFVAVGMVLLSIYAGSPDGCHLQLCGFTFSLL